ncbi:MAG: 23S rRNA (uracil(1939)-C(5))-methyltransferase RlmD [Candidatus Cloacimonetes bacterium]|nr:23S rRNA (uracil(1939)-C(5))-methyltransferase RlmD [Candidatus Cloacimonadota bacterium]
MGRNTRKRLKGQTAKVQFGKMNWKGMFAASLEGESLSVTGGFPDAEAEVLITRIEGKKLRGRKVEFFEPVSESVIAAPCPVFLQCGGCKLQHVEYKRQLELKTDLLVPVLDSIAKRQGFMPELKSTVSSPRIFTYRNKMELTFSELREGRFFGMHADGSFGTVIDTDFCHLALEPMHKVIKAVSEWYKNGTVPGYNPYRNSGVLRHLVLRASEYENKVLVNFVATEWCNEILDITEVISGFPEVSGVFFTKNSSLSDAVIYAEFQILKGENRLRERLGNFVFDISIQSFFQVNSGSAVRLYQEISDMLFEYKATAGTVLDLYCGAGSIGIYLSPLFEKVIGVEEVSEAITDAKKNASLNQILNTQYLNRKVESLEEDELKAWGAQTIILDPPRSGCHPKARKSIANLKVKHLIFVSCNPRILPENLGDFLDAGYEVIEVRPVDLFPQTPHLEAVLYLRLKE